MFCKTKNHEQYLRWRFCVLITNICWCFVQCSEFVYFRTNFLGCTKCIQHFEIPVMPIFNVLAGSCEVSVSRMSVFWFSNERNVCKIKLIWPFYRCQIFCFFLHNFKSSTEWIHHIDEYNDVDQITNSFTSLGLHHIVLIVKIYATQKPIWINANHVSCD